MLSIATRAALRPTNATLARSLAIRASSVHTLPELPYAYNVRLIHTESIFILTLVTTYRPSNRTSQKR
jgi:hypothetical protein